jgi:hypothetical protein
LEMRTKTSIACWAHMRIYIHSEHWNLFLLGKNEIKGRDMLVTYCKMEIYYQLEMLGQADSEARESAKTPKIVLASADRTALLLPPTNKTIFILKCNDEMSAYLGLF